MAPVAPFAKAQQEILGEDHAYPMIAYGTLQTSAAWKLYAKSQGIPFDLANAVSEQIKKYENALKHADEDEKDDIDPLDYISKEYHEIFNKSAEYRSIVSSWSIAPCSYLLYQGNIRKEIGLVKIKDHICCMMDGHWAESGHFLKNDLLKVSVVDLIYRTFQRIGLEPFPVNDLLTKCTPDDLSWSMYSKGCTVGLNQVEKTATSARVAKYKPQNISELCAFVAAIRPGFKSMYKIFESRQPFAYGVKAFDELIQTEEMPNSFVLYQEMEMALLNYAGIDMADCYTAIKNIAKKRAEKVLAYKEKFIDGFSAAIIRDEGTSKQDADELAQELWQIIEDSASYSFNACVSGDTKLRRFIGDCCKSARTVEEMFRDHKIYGIEYGNALSMFPDKKIRENRIVDIREAGVRNLYRVRINGDRYIDCTMNHKFPTPKGEMKLEDLKVGDILYGSVLDVYGGWGEIEAIEYLRTDMTYDVEMADPAHTIVSESGLVASNSHSYCVSVDSLYSAWLKAHYPCEFYETLMLVSENKGNKDKMNEAKEEAEKYFNIKFPPFRFGTDNRTLKSIPEENIINNSLSSIKGYSKTIAQKLYDCAQTSPKRFVDVLKYMNGKSVKAAKIEPLIKIDYFSQYGNGVQLLYILSMWDLMKQGAAKEVDKDKFPSEGPLVDMIKKYTTDLKKDGTKRSSFKFLEDDSCFRFLCDYEDYVMQSDVPDFDFKTKAENQRKVLGYVDMTTGKEEDRRDLFILDLYSLEDRFRGGVWKYKIKTKSIGSGKVSQLDVSPALMKAKPIEKGDVIRVPQGGVAKDRKGYWQLYDYEVAI